MNSLHLQYLRAIVAEVSERYPVAMFPDPAPGCLPDRYSAAGARLACRAILAELERAAQPLENIEELEPANPEPLDEIAVCPICKAWGTVSGDVPHAPDYLLKGKP